MRRSKLKKDGLNVIPLIDVMLVLLCIVLSISTFIAQGNINIDLPKSKSGEGDPNKEVVNIIIDANSTIYLDDKPILETEFEEYMKEIDPKTSIVLRSDKEAKFESFVKIIDILKLKKHENFAIATETRK